MLEIVEEPFVNRQGLYHVWLAREEATRQCVPVQVNPLALPSTEF